MLALLERETVELKPFKGVTEIIASVDFAGPEPFIVAKMLVGLAERE